VSGVDIGAAVRGAVEAGVAKKGGGHAMAAGVTIEQHRLHELAAYLREALAPSYRAASAAPVLPVDGSQISAVAFRAANSEIGTALAEGRDLACHVAGRIERDEWVGKSRIEFQIEDVAAAAKR
jgi:single-stranded-DNA-specific exonuclease